MLLAVKVECWDRHPGTVFSILGYLEEFLFWWGGWGRLLTEKMECSQVLDPHRLASASAECGHLSHPSSFPFPLTPSLLCDGTQLGKS